MSTTLTSVRLTPETDERLSRLARDTGRSKAFYIRHLIYSGLDQIEYEYRILQDVSDYRARKLKTHSMDEVREAYDLKS